MKVHHYRHKCLTILFLLLNRRQVQGPTLHYYALLDTLVLKEKGAIFEVLEIGRAHV